MRFRISPSVPVRLGATAILVAIAGMIIQIIGGVKYPTVPPGIVILAVTAALLTVVRWPAIRLLGVVAPLFILIGGFASAQGRYDISHPGHVDAFLGTLIQLTGLAAAVACGTAAILEWRASRAGLPARAHHATRPL